MNRDRLSNTHPATGRPQLSRRDLLRLAGAAAMGAAVGACAPRSAIPAARSTGLVQLVSTCAMEGIDVFLTPSYAGDVLLMTNLTGHPTVVLPSGFDEEGHPQSISFVGNLWKDGDALRVAKAWQDATGHHLRHPPLFSR